VYTGASDEGRLVPRDWLDQAPVTRTLLALNIAVFVVQVVVSGGLGLTASTDLRLGASYAMATIGENRWETLVTACFLHGGIVHLGFNMLALWQAGPLVERAVGSARMAPMYLVAGAFGNVLSVAYGWRTHSGLPSVGASGAISGVIAAALVVGWRVQGWRGPLTQAMVRWLGFLVVFGLFSNLAGASIDNAAHIGGAIMGAVFASMWKRGYRYSSGATKAILGTCVGVVATCIALVAFHDRTDPFAPMTVQARQDFMRDAVRDGRCRDAHDGLLAVERLRGPMPSLRKPVELTCGHVGE
jgi:membrane associated rhomboid family serine protease